MMGIIFFFWAIMLLVIFIMIKKIFWVQKIPDILNQKHVLVTGGSSGIGKSAAIEAAKLGAHVTIVARNKDKLELVVEEIRKVAKNLQNQKINCVSFDVAKGYNYVEKKLMDIEDMVGPIFLLINCAGTAQCGRIEDMLEIDYRNMMELNYFGTVFPTLVVAKKMKERNEGHIVITGSQASLIGIYGMSAYCSSKFALRGFAESLHMEMSPYNITVTLCLPPDTKTPGYENEMKSKPPITKLISATGGLFEPHIVAYTLLSDALTGKFFSIVGFESFILTTLCSGMSPIQPYSDGILQVFLMSFLKFISIGYLHYFSKIISHNLTPKAGEHKVKKAD